MTDSKRNQEFQNRHVLVQYLEAATNQPNQYSCDCNDLHDSILLIYISLVSCLYDDEKPKCRKPVTYMLPLRDRLGLPWQLLKEKKSERHTIDSSSSYLHTFSLCSEPKSTYSPYRLLFHALRNSSFSLALSPTDFNRPVRHIASRNASPRGTGR